MTTILKTASQMCQIAFDTLSAYTQETLSLTLSPTMQDLWLSRQCLWRMPSFGMWCHVGLVRTDVSEEHVASLIRVERTRELGRTSAVPLVINIVHSLWILSTLKMQVTCSSKMSIVIRPTQHIPEDGILHDLPLSYWQTFRLNGHRLSINSIHKSEGTIIWEECSLLADT
jgi:hypothetical protein